MKILINESTFKKIITILEQEIDYDLYDTYDDVKFNIFRDFLYNNNQDFTKNIKWNVIPFNRLKKIWQDFMTYGVVRDERGLEMIQDIMTENIIKIDIFTELLGHTPHSPKEDFDDNIGVFVNDQLDCLLNTEDCNTNIHPYIKKLFDENYDDDRDKIYEFIYEHLLDKFYWSYSEDPNIGQSYISDYGLKPLLQYLEQLRKSKSPEEKIPIMDKILNVVHQRSDMASWFVEGGSYSLSKLSS